MFIATLQLFTWATRFFCFLLPVSQEPKCQGGLPEDAPLPLPFPLPEIWISDRHIYRAALEMRTTPTALYKMTSPGELPPQGKQKAKKKRGLALPTFFLPFTYFCSFDLSSELQP